MLPRTITWAAAGPLATTWPALNSTSNSQNERIFMGETE